MAKKKLAWLEPTAYILVLIGAINLGLVTAFNFNLISSIFGMVFYKWASIAVGISGAGLLIKLFRGK